MAVFTKVGSFNTGTGAIGSTVVVNDVGFQPKVVLFWWNGRTGTVDASGRANHKRGFGVGTSATDRRYVTALSQDTPTSMLTNAMQGNAACIGVTTTADAIDGLMDIQSIDSGGFTLVVDDVFTASYRVHYMAIGGNEITDAVTGQFTAPAAGGTGTQDVTGLSFQPDFLMVFTTGQASANNTVRADSRMMIGAATSAANDAVWSAGSNDGAANAQAMSYARGGDVIALFNTTVTGIDDRAEFTSFLSDGFRLNWTAVAAGGSFIFFLAMKGGRLQVGTDNTFTNTSTPIELGGYWVPRGGLIVSACKPQDSSGTPSDDDEWSMGAFSSTSERVAMSTADDDAAATAIVSTGVSHDQVYQNLNANTGAVEGEMDVSAIGAESVTFIMDDADPVASFFWYVIVAQTFVFQTNSGGITPSGALSKITNKTLSGAITSAGALLKTVSKFFSGVLTLAGDLVAEFQAAGNEFFQDVSGGLTPSGALQKMTSKFFTGGITPSGATIKSTAKALSGALSSIVGTLSTNRGYIRSFDGSITPSGTISKQDNKALSGSVTPSGSLTTANIFGKILDGALTLAGAVTKQTNKLLAGSLTSDGTLAKSISKLLSGALTLSGSLAKQVSKILSGAITFAGDLIADLLTGGQTFFKELAGSITPTGTLSKIASKLLSGNITPTGSFSASSMFVKVLEGTLALSGTVTKSISKQLSGVLTSSATLVKSVSKFFSGTLTSSGTATKQSNKSFSGNVTPTGALSFIRLFVIALEGTLSLAGNISKSISKNLAGNITPIGTITKLISKALSGVLNLAGTLATIFGVTQIVDRVYLLGSRVITVHLPGAVSRVKVLAGRAKRIISLRGKRDLDIE
jgi:hypothetical protein